MGVVFVNEMGCNILNTHYPAFHLLDMLAGGLLLFSERPLIEVASLGLFGECVKLGYLPTLFEGLDSEPYASANCSDSEYCFEGLPGVDGHFKDYE